jgi:hypothetical protein
MLMETDARCSTGSPVGVLPKQRTPGNLHFGRSSDGVKLINVYSFRIA